MLAGLFPRATPPAFTTPHHDTTPHHGPPQRRRHIRVGYSSGLLSCQTLLSPPCRCSPPPSAHRWQHRVARRNRAVKNPPLPRRPHGLTHRCSSCPLRPSPLSYTLLRMLPFHKCTFKYSSLRPVRPPCSCTNVRRTVVPCPGIATVSLSTDYRLSS